MRSFDACDIARLCKHPAAYALCDLYQKDRDQVALAASTSKALYLIVWRIHRDGGHLIDTHAAVFDFWKLFNALPAAERETLEACGVVKVFEAITGGDGCRRVAAVETSHILLKIAAKQLNFFQRRRLNVVADSSCSTTREKIDEGLKRTWRRLKDVVLSRRNLR